MDKTGIVISKKYQFVLLIIIIIFILLNTLYPFKFKTDINIDSIIWDTSTNRDIFFNILFFVPLGLIVTVICLTNKLNIVITGIIVFFFSFFLSCAIEVVQIFLPSRYPSYFDILSNTSGSVLGALVIILFTKFDIPGLLKQFFSNKLRLAITILFYIFFCVLLKILIDPVTGLKNWKYYPLQIGNEYTGNRQWNGEIYKLMMYDTCLDQAEFEELFSNNFLNTHPDHLLLDLPLTENNKNQTVQFTWHDKKEDRLLSVNDKLIIHDNRWLTSNRPPKILIDRIKKTNQFSIIIHMNSDTRQNTINRIFALSKSPYVCNFMLGHYNDDLIFRLSTPLTGDNGTMPYTSIPDFFKSKQHHKLMITYDSKTIRFYDQNGIIAQTKLIPEAYFIKAIINLNTINLDYYLIVYYFILLIPLLFLMAVFKRT